MKQSFAHMPLIYRVVALFLAIAIGMPPPALALRPVESAEAQETLAGLEEKLKAKTETPPLVELTRNIHPDPMKTPLNGSFWARRTEASGISSTQPTTDYGTVTLGPDGTASSMEVPSPAPARTFWQTHGQAGLEGGEEPLERTLEYAVAYDLVGRYLQEATPLEQWHFGAERGMESFMADPASRQAVADRVVDMTRLLVDSNTKRSIEMQNLLETLLKSDNGVVIEEALASQIPYLLGRLATPAFNRVHTFLRGLLKQERIQQAIIQEIPNLLARPELRINLFIWTFLQEIVDQSAFQHSFSAFIPRIVEGLGSEDFEVRFYTRNFLKHLGEREPYQKTLAETIPQVVELLARSYRGIGRDAAEFLLWSSDKSWAVDALSGQIPSFFGLLSGRNKDAAERTAPIILHFASHSVLRIALEGHVHILAGVLTSGVENPDTFRFVKGTVAGLALAGVAPERLALEVLRAFQGHVPEDVVGRDRLDDLLTFFFQKGFYSPSVYQRALRSVSRGESYSWPLGIDEGINGKSYGIVMEGKAKGLSVLRDWRGGVIPDKTHLVVSEKDREGDLEPYRRAYLQSESSRQEVSLFEPGLRAWEEDPESARAFYIGMTSGGGELLFLMPWGELLGLDTQPLHHFLQYGFSFVRDQVPGMRDATRYFAEHPKLESLWEEQKEAILHAALVELPTGRGPLPVPLVSDPEGALPGSILTDLQWKGLQGREAVGEFIQHGLTQFLRDLLERDDFGTFYMSWLHLRVFNILDIPIHGQAKMIDDRHQDYEDQAQSALSDVRPQDLPRVNFALTQQTVNEFPDLQLRQGGYWELRVSNVRQILSELEMAGRIPNGEGLQPTSLSDEPGLGLRLLKHLQTGAIGFFKDGTLMLPMRYGENLEEDTTPIVLKPLDVKAGLEGVEGVLDEVTGWRTLETALQREIAAVAQRLGSRMQEDSRLLDPRLLGVGPDGLKAYGRELTWFLSQVKSQASSLNLLVLLVGEGASSYERESAILLGVETAEAAAGALRGETGRLEYFATEEEAKRLTVALSEWNADLTVGRRPVDTLPLILRQILGILAGIDSEEVGTFYEGIDFNELADHLKTLAGLGV